MLGQDQSIQAKEHEFKMFNNTSVISWQKYESYYMTHKKPSSTKSFG